MARAAKGDGSVIRAGAGWRAYVTIAGKRKYTKIYATKALASAAKRDLLKRRDDGRVVGGPTDTVEAWMRHWVAHVADMKPSSRRFTEWLIEKHIGPTLGGVKLEALTVERIEAWLGGLDLKPSSKRRYLGPLRSALNAAVDRGRVGYNVAERVKLAGPGKPHVDAMSREDRAAILSAATGRNRVRWHLALVLGLRPGEALGLTWNDFDEHKGTLTIRNQLLYVKGKGTYLEPTAKTASGERRLRLPAGLVQLLREHRREQMLEIAAYSEWRAWGYPGDPVPLMFTKPDGSPIGERADRNEWNRLLTAAGLSGRRRYASRHTAASLAIVDSGGDAAVVAKMLGHSDPSFTYRVYVHPLEEREDALADKLDAPYRAPYDAPISEGQ